MKHLKRFNESISIEETPILIRKNIPMIINQSKVNGLSLDDLIGVIKDEWVKSEKKIEKSTFTNLSTDEKDQMMSDALKMSEMQWMKKYLVGDHGDYLRMAKSKLNIE